MKLSFVAERDLYNGGFTVCSVSQIFISKLGAAWIGPSVERFDSMSFEHEKIIVEEVCIVCVGALN
jgi:hypothetical protein